MYLVHLMLIRFFVGWHGCVFVLVCTLYKTFVFFLNQRKHYHVFRSRIMLSHFYISGHFLIFFAVKNHDDWKSIKILKKHWLEAPYMAKQTFSWPNSPKFQFFETKIFSKYKIHIHKPYCEAARVFPFKLSTR